MTAGDMMVYLSDRETGTMGVYPAVVVWELSDGMAWVQPGYLDPFGASSRQFHRLRGETRNWLGSIAVSTPEFDALAVGAGDPPEDVKQALAWYRQELERLGLDRQEEAERLSRELAEDLA